MSVLFFIKIKTTAKILCKLLIEVSLVYFENQIIFISIKGLPALFLLKDLLMSKLLLVEFVEFLSKTPF